MIRDRWKRKKRKMGDRGSTEGPWLERACRVGWGEGTHTIGHHPGSPTKPQRDFHSPPGSEEAKERKIPTVGKTAIAFLRSQLPVIILARKCNTPFL